MAHSLSAKKRIRQNAKRRMRNRARMSSAKTQVKHYLAIVKEQNPDTIETELRLAQKKIDRLADKGIIHKNKASRQKSQLAKIRNQAIANA